MRYLATIPLAILLLACSDSRDADQPSLTESDGMGMPGMTDGEGMMQDGRMMPDSMPLWMMSEDMMQGMMGDMRTIHGLLTQHARIEREVEDIPGGVRTVTTSEDQSVAELIRTHVRQMKDRMEGGRSIREMDPLFRELFAHHDEIRLEIEEVPGGVRVIETSNDSDVVKLIRQHAHKFVDEVVARGMRRALSPTPLPEGYRR